MEFILPTICFCHLWSITLISKQSNITCLNNFTFQIAYLETNHHFPTAEQQLSDLFPGQILQIRITLYNIQLSQKQRIPLEHLDNPKTGLTELVSDV